MVVTHEVRERPALEKDTRYPLVVCLLATRETAFPRRHRGGQNVVTKRAVTMRIATLCCLIAGASAFGTLERISCWDGGCGRRRGSACPVATGESLRSFTYVRGRRKERRQRQGRVMARRERGLGGGSGYCVLCAGFAMLVTGEVMC